MQAYVLQADGMFAELHNLRNAQFAAEHQEISRFEQKAAEGCQYLCNHVHSIAGNHSEVRQVVVNLIAKVQELAESINHDHQSFLTHQGSTGATNERLEKVGDAVNEIKEYINTSRTAVDARFSNIE
jgi:methyl-accepting chemotaxis protein